MKTRVALVTAGALILAPAIAVAAQSAQPAGDQPVQTPAPAKAPGKDASSVKPGTNPDAKCQTGKSADSKPAHASAKVGKDTGDLPPPKKTSNADCATQDQGQPQ